MKKVSYSLIASLSCLILVSCINNHQVNYKAVDEKLLPIQNHSSDNITSKEYSTERSFDIHQHYISSNVKYYNYKKYDDKGEILPVAASGVSGRFFWDNNCLVFISVDGSKATPLLPYGITQWDGTSKTLTIESTPIKIGELIETNGTFSENLANRQGFCWNYPYIVSIGVMGGIKVLKSEEDLIFKPR